MLESWYPLLTVTTFQTILWGTIFLLRKAITFCLVKGNIHTLFCILLASIQITLASFENTLIYQHYGICAFWGSQFLTLVISNVVNDGSSANPLTSIKDLNKELITLKGAPTIIAQFAITIPAYYVVQWIWDVTAPINRIHFAKSNLKCKYAVNGGEWALLAYEFLAPFLLTVVKKIVKRLPLPKTIATLMRPYKSRSVVVAIRNQIKFWFVAMITAFFLSLELGLLGVTGVNPMVALSRFTFCQDFTPVYAAIHVLAPAGGHVCAALLVNMYRKKLKRAVPAAAL